MDVFESIGTYLMKGSELKANRLPTFYPSAASCVSELDGKPIGACLRAQFYRCAGYEVTNPSGLYSQYIFAAGNLWEDKMCEWFKEIGIWSGNTIKFQDTKRYISGEIDILIKNPETNKKYIVEMKTYSSANYQAKKELVGSVKTKPRPKDQNLLQSFIYLDQFQGQVDETLLLYYDRACGGPENNKQFNITSHTANQKQYPIITTKDYSGAPYQYIDKRITIQGIYERYESLRNHLVEGKMPAPDYKHTYTDKEIPEKFAEGIITKTKYEEWTKDPSKVKIGDWQCGWCDYKDLCKAYQDEGQ